jgi:hypothetical protein
MSAPDKSCKCPVCGGRARWSLMKTGRVCITHGDCCQVFARGDDGDEEMRDRFIGGNERNERNVREPEAAEPVTNVQQGEGFDVWPT